MGEKATYGQFSFNGGEVSALMHGRVDQNAWAVSCRTMVGWLPLVEGPATAAPGTYYVEAAAGPCRLIPFEYNPTQGYVVEASEELLRFYTNDARIETSPGVAYEVASPYSYDETLALDHCQVGDVLYLAGGGRQQRTLSRTGAESFSLGVLDLLNGPFDPGNSDATRTITASGTTGSVTLTASAAIFAATDVGSLFEIEAADYGDVPGWEPGITVSVGEKRTWAGKVYQRVSGGATRTGGNPPVHDSGTEWDGSGSGTDVNSHGPYGVKWQFLYGRHGLVRITGFISATQATATVLKRLADSLTATPSQYWAFGAFSDTRGWPDAVCEWNDSLVFFKGKTGYVSVVGDLHNFERRDSSGDFQRDLAGTFQVPSKGKILWGVADGVLLVGTETGIFPVERLQIQTGTAGPPVFEVKKPVRSGSARVKIADAAGRLLVVEKARRKLLELDFAALRDRYEAPNLLKRARHIGRPGIVELAWTAEPEPLAWTVDAAGGLAAMAYEPGEEVKGWARRTLGGGLLARSICSISDPSGEHAQLWIAAETPQESNGSGAHWILRMAPMREQGAPAADAFLLDAGLSYEGAPVAGGTGAAHLAGETVQVLADGKPHPDIVIGGGGQWVIGYPAAKVHLGYGFPAALGLLPPEAGQHEGVAQGKVKRIPAVTLRLLESQGLRMRVSGGDWFDIEHRTAADAMDAAVPLFTGDIRIDLVGDYDRLGLIEIERVQPVPATVLALFPSIVTGER
jgi:hypothetical protein